MANLLFDLSFRTLRNTTQLKHFASSPILVPKRSCISALSKRSMPRLVALTTTLRARNSHFSSTLTAKWSHRPSKYHIRCHAIDLSFCLVSAFTVLYRVPTLSSERRIVNPHLAYFLEAMQLPYFTCSACFPSKLHKFWPISSFILWRSGTR